jgi:tRNA-splicing ligase RtcB
VRCPSNKGLAEEAPFAYKEVEAVVEVVERAGLAVRVAQLRPLGVVKGWCHARDAGMRGSAVERRAAQERDPARAMQPLAVASSRRARLAWSHPPLRSSGSRTSSTPLERTSSVSPRADWGG